MHSEVSRFVQCPSISLERHTLTEPGADMLQRRRAEAGYSTKTRASSQIP